MLQVEDHQVIYASDLLCCIIYIYITLYNYHIISLWSQTYAKH